MHIKRFDIQNFRKLKCCKIELSDETTVFVGANNSGKTSAMDALAKFLSTRKFAFDDITLSNRKKLDDIGVAWIKGEQLDFENCILEIEEIMPSLDIWIDVKDNELHYVSNIIPTLEWAGGILGVRFIYLPKNIEKLYTAYKEAYEAAAKMCANSPKVKLSLWPQNFCDYLGKEDLFHKLFEIKAYVLDPSKMDNDELQTTDYLMECTTSNPLEGLVKIDIIGAQRGFSDTVNDNTGEANYHAQNLSSQLKSYYDKHNLSRYVSKRNSKIKRFFKSFGKWILLVFIAIIFGYAVITFGFQTVTVVGPSMNPTLEDSQVVFVNKIVYRFSDIKRYDVIAFSKVGDENQYYDIKRVIGLPEEKVRISNGDIYINGERRSDVPFEMAIQISGVAEDEITLGEDEYFVMGDNVNNSEDSRYTNVGNISKTEITGKVVSIVLPRSDKGKVK